MYSSCTSRKKLKLGMSCTHQSSTVGFVHIRWVTVQPLLPWRNWCHRWFWRRWATIIQTYKLFRSWFRHQGHTEAGARSNLRRCQKPPRLRTISGDEGARSEHQLRILGISNFVYTRSTCDENRKPLHNSATATMVCANIQQVYVAGTYHQIRIMQHLQ